MFTLTRPVAAILTSGVLLCGAARADIIDDIKSVATDARNRATEARDRAKEARDRATEARDKATEIVDRVRAGVANLTDQVRAAVTDEVQNVKQLLADQIEGYREFELERCDEFRDQLLSILVDLQSLNEAVNELITPPDCFGAMSKEDRRSKLLGRLIDKVQSVDCKLLYPIFRGLPDLCILRELRQDVEALKTIKRIVGDSLGGPGGQVEEHIRPLDSTDRTAIDDADRFEARLRSALPFLENHDLLAAWVEGRAKQLALSLKLTGKSLRASSELLKIGGTLGLHGYALVDAKSDPLKSLGENFESLGTIVGEIAKEIQDNLKNAEAVSTQRLILANQAALFAEIAKAAPAEPNGTGKTAEPDPIAAATNGVIGCETVSMTAIALLCFGLTRKFPSPGVSGPQA